jgi:hypothetical protein
MLWKLMEWMMMMTNKAHTVHHTVPQGYCTLLLVVATSPAWLGRFGFGLSCQVEAARNKILIPSECQFMRVITK